VYDKNIEQAMSFTYLEIETSSRNLQKEVRAQINAAIKISQRSDMTKQKQVGEQHNKNI